MVHPTHWGNFTLVHPWVLFFFLALPILLFLKGKIGDTPAVQFSSTATMSTLSQGSRSQAGAVLNTITFLTIALLLLAAARPQQGKSNVRIQASGVDIMLAFDVSGSMRAEDMSGGGKRTSRMEAVKSIAQQFITKRLNDRIGIIAFAGRPYLISPPTLDHSWLITNISRIQVGMIEDSTAIGSAIAAAARRLKDRSSKSKILILLTDGANNAGHISPLTAAEAARLLGIKIYTIGAGSSSGPAPYPVVDMFGGTQYQMVEFDSDLHTLKDIAERTGGKCFRATDSQSLRRIFQEINRMEKSQVATSKTSFHWDLFPWPVSTALMLLIVEIILSQTIWKQLP